MMVLGVGSSGVIRSWGWIPQEWNQCPYKRELPCPFHHERTQQKEDHPWSRFSADTECAATVPWDFPASKTSRTDLCCSLCCAQSWPTLCIPVDCNPPGSSVHGIFQARKLEWVAISSTMGFSWPKIEPMSKLVFILATKILTVAPKCLELSSLV